MIIINNNANSSHKIIINICKSEAKGVDVCTNDDFGYNQL